MDNTEEDDIGKVHAAVKANSRSCLLAAFPGCTIMDPLPAFSEVDEETELDNIISSGRIPIWKEGDPVYLTATAYQDLAEYLAHILSGGQTV